MANLQTCKLFCVRMKSDLSLSEFIAGSKVVRYALWPDACWAKLIPANSKTLPSRCLDALDWRQCLLGQAIYYVWLVFKTVVNKEVIKTARVTGTKQNKQLKSMTGWLTRELIRVWCGKVSRTFHLHRTLADPDVGGLDGPHGPQIEQWSAWALTQL